MFILGWICLICQWVWAQVELRQRGRIHFPLRKLSHYPLMGGGMSHMTPPSMSNHWFALDLHVYTHTHLILVPDLSTAPFDLSTYHFLFFYLFFSSFPVSWYLTSPYSLWFHPMSFLLSFLSVFCFGFCPSQSCLSAQGCRIILSVISHSFILALAMSALSTMTPQFQENSSAPSPDLHASAWEKENNIWFFKVIFCDFLSFCCCCHCWSDKSYSPSKNFLFNFV